ncbi:MAG: hypothetical protein U5L08_07630 [Xanthomonadales bacterium]|nr:hypothetical protein [Xanthomonadales bacterium]
MKNIRAIGEFLDNSLGTLLGAWGCFTVIFIFCLPLIFLAAFIKWLIINGHLG